MSKPFHNGRLEGDAQSRLIQLMKIYGYNEEMKVFIAEVTSLNPFAIHIDGDPEDIDMESLVVSQHLLPHELVVSLDGGPEKVLTVHKTYLKVGDKAIVISYRDEQQYIVMDKALLSSN